MRKHFPPFDAVEHEWINIAENSGPKVRLIEELLEQQITAPYVLVEVHRQLGGFFSKQEALAFICTHLGKGHIRVANREFTSFVVIASNGVATGWQAQPTPTNHTDTKQ
jgi:hypothetical protein